MPGTEVKILAVPLHDSFTVLADSTTDNSLRMTRSGQLFVADWRQNLLLAGYCYTFDVGTMAAGGNITMITGGGAGTTIDQDRPEFGFGVAAGTTLIPLRIQVACQVDLDADVEEGNIILTADLACGLATDGTRTAETPVNLLHGATDFGGTAFSACTADLTDPTVSLVLAFETFQNSEVTGA